MYISYEDIFEKITTYNLLEILKFDAYFLTHGLQNEYAEKVNNYLLKLVNKIADRRPLF